MPNNKFKIKTFFIILFAFALFVQAAVAVNVYSGDTIELSGGASGSDYVYLFLCGPNLPSGGVSPDDISSEVQTGVPSSFTRVSVDNNNIWRYKWDTKTQGGTPDTGNYIMYAVNSPSGRKDLAGTEYSYTQITLADPSVSVQPGADDNPAESPLLPAETAKAKPTGEKTTGPAEKTHMTEIQEAEKSSSPKPSAGGFFGTAIFAVLASALILISGRKT